MELRLISNAVTVWDADMSEASDISGGSSNAASHKEAQSAARHTSPGRAQNPEEAQSAVRHISSGAARNREEAQSAVRHTSSDTVQNHEAPPPLTWHAKPGAGRIQELNRRLACIDTQQDAASVNILLQKEADQRPSGQIYVLISKNQDSISMELLHALASGNEILWVIPVAPGESLLHAGMQGIRMMRWEVNI